MPNKNIKTDVFPILLRYATAAGHDLIAKHAAEAAGVALSTAFSKIAIAKAEAKILSSIPNAASAEEFQALWRYAEVSGHKLNANAVASAAGIAKSTAFNKIAAAKKRVIAAEDPKGEATKQPTPELPPSRKRKASADLEVGDIEGYVTKSSPKKKRGAKNSKPAQLTWATALSPETYEAEEGVSEGRAKQEVHKQGEAAQAGPEDIPVVSVEKDEN